VQVEELAAPVIDLRQEGSDTSEVEVKRAAGGDAGVVNMIGRSGQRETRYELRT
jgi:hypothetical protein